MSLLTMIGQVANTLGQPAPAVVATSTDAMVLEWLAMANTSGRALVIAFPWQELTSEVTFTSSSAYNQGTINGTLVTAGDFDRMIDNTLWNRSAIMQATGPITEVEWQQDMSFSAAAPFPKYKINKAQLFIGPSVPNSTDTWAFSYISNAFCQSASGSAQNMWLTDTDTGILSESLMKLDIVWRWKASKSLEYADDLANFEDEFANRTGQTTGGRSLYLGGANVIFPINVPEGNWPTS